LVERVVHINPGGKNYREEGEKQALLLELVKRPHAPKNILKPTEQKVSGGMLGTTKKILAHGRLTRRSRENFKDLRRGEVSQ